jgi:hypothetical protein
MKLATTRATQIHRATLVLAACAAFAGACSSPDVVLATIPAPGPDGGANTYIRCAGTPDCPSGSYCDKPSCGADTGTCQLFPPECDGDQSPAVCGCNEVTYFNDCLRRAGGIAASTPGGCPLGRTAPCGGASNAACPAGLYCAELLGMGANPCTTGAQGTCWVLPATCPSPTPGPDQWTSCQGGGACVDTCTAIRTGGPHARARTCP